MEAVAPNNNVVAMCDVDTRHSANTFKKFPEAKQFRDFRKMFDAMEKQIDAVVVATPDHFHAVAAMAAIKRKKHVYCEKPACHNPREGELAVAAARTPAGMAMASAMTRLRPMSRTVFQSRGVSTCQTGNDCSRE